MGECIISSGRTNYMISGGSGSIQTNLPVLNEEYPIDNIVFIGSSIKLSCIISLYPSNCTYQWYCDNQPIDNANNYIYEFIPSEVKKYNFFCIIFNDIGSVISRTCTIHVYNNEFKLTEGTKKYVLFTGLDSTNANSSLYPSNMSYYTTDSAPTSIYNKLEMKLQNLMNQSNTCTITIGDKKKIITTSGTNTSTYIVDISDVDEDYSIHFSHSSTMFVYSIRLY